MTKTLFSTADFSRFIRLLCLAGCGVFGGLVLNLALTPTQSAWAATCTGGSITGFAFRDYNLNGVEDTLEPGIAGIVVTAYAVGGVTASCETGTDGAYGLTPTGAFPVRLEFALPSDGHLNFLQPGVKGANSGTTVTFLDGPADKCQCRV